MSVNIAQLFAPKATDVAYSPISDPIIAFIFRTDSYKFTHPFMFKELNKRLGKKRVVGMSSYAEARVKSNQQVTVFGGQIAINKLFQRPITMADVDAAEAFALAHFGRPLFLQEGACH